MKNIIHLIEIICNWDRYRHRYFKINWSGLISALAILSSISPAVAANFNVTYAPGTTNEQKEGVELAVLLWEQHLNDSDVDVNFYFQMTSGQLGGSLGASLTGTQQIDYDDFKEGLNTLDPLSGGANRIFADAADPNYYRRLVQDNNQVDSIDTQSYQLWTTTANHKAIGNGVGGNASGLDGYIELDSNFNWDYNHDGNTQGSKFDFVTVISHEIGHILGFTSGLDIYDQTEHSNTSEILPMAMDMFKYSTNSSAQGAIDFGFNESYFSVDGGITPLTTDLDGNGITGDWYEQARHAEGIDTAIGGDGYQASHWLHSLSTPRGLMDPKLKKGTEEDIDIFDLTVLDYIGWDVNYNPTYDLNALQTLAVTNAANAPVEDLSEEVAQMMVNSGIYNWGWGSGGGWGMQGYTDEELIAALAAQVSEGILFSTDQPIAHGLQPHDHDHDHNHNHDHDHDHDHNHDHDHDHYDYHVSTTSSVDSQNAASVPEPRAIAGMIATGSLLLTRRLLLIRRKKQTRTKNKQKLIEAK